MGFRGMHVQGQCGMCGWAASICHPESLNLLKHCNINCDAFLAAKSRFKPIAVYVD